MDLHVRSVSSANRPVTSGRVTQPIRLQLARPAAVTPVVVEAAPEFHPLHDAQPGAFAYEQGSFVLAGQTEIDPDGRSRVKGTARFQQGKLSLDAEGRFELGYEGSETALIGDGEFVWKDGRTFPLSGRGSLAVRQDRQGNAIIQLDGTITARHQTITIEGPAQAEIDTRANGAFIVRLKGKARLDTSMASLDGDLDLTCGEVDGERLDWVTLHGRAQTRSDVFETGGDAAFSKRRSYGRPATVLTITGPGTYQHGQLSCEGQIVLRIIPHGAGEAYDGTILGTGYYQSPGLTAAGRVHGAFFQHGERHDFDGRLDGDVSLQAVSASVASSGAVELSLRQHTTAWQVTPAADTQWVSPGLTGSVANALWKRASDGTTMISGTGRLHTSLAPWWFTLKGAVGISDGAEGWTLSAAGTMAGGMVGGLVFEGPAKLGFETGLCQVSGRVKAAATLAGAGVAAGAAVALEMAALPDGRPFWHARLGGPLRPVTFSATEGPTGPVARIRQSDAEQPVNALVPLATLQAPPAPPDEQAEGDADPEWPKPKEQA